MIGTRTWLAGIAAAALSAVGGALVTQHVFGMQPCVWCVLQRAIFVSIAIAALLALLLPGILRKAAIGLALLLALSGVSAALWQHFVASNAASCDLSLAERIVGGLKLDEQLPAVFMATATCAEAKVKLFGLPYEFWSLTLFVLLGAAALRLLLARKRRFNG